MCKKMGTYWQKVCKVSCDKRLLICKKMGTCENLCWGYSGMEGFRQQLFRKYDFRWYYSL